MLPVLEGVNPRQQRRGAAIANAVPEGATGRRDLIGAKLGRKLLQVRNRGHSHGLGLASKPFHRIDERRSRDIRLDLIRR
jgi:hypothetical protein